MHKSDKFFKPIEANDKLTSNKANVWPVLKDPIRWGRSHGLSEFSKETVVKKVLQPVIAEDLLLCSDGLSVYNAFASEAGVVDKAVNVSAGIPVVEKVLHIQNVNAYRSRFNTWTRRLNGVAIRYLPNYLGWYHWLDGNVNVLTTPQALSLTAVGVS